MVSKLKEILGVHQTFVKIMKADKKWPAIYEVMAPNWDEGGLIAGANCGAFRIPDTRLSPAAISDSCHTGVKLLSPSEMGLACDTRGI